jgi:Ni/Co efflux regulator RcnB
MKTLGLLGLALALSVIPGIAMAQRDSAGFQGARGAMATPRVHNGTVRSWGGRHNGRWIGGHRAPGGFNAYRPAVRGFILPRYWIQPSFFIGNYARYGFSAPQSGYGWSRYYDDAVLSDRSGRVYDSVRGVDWDRYDRYEDGAEDYSDSYGYRDDGYSSDGRDYRSDDPRVRERDRDGGAGGAVIGGVAGAVAGNVIGGRGNRVLGSVIGGAVGAAAGAAIDINDRAGRGPKIKKLSRRDRERLERRDGRRYEDRGGAVADGRWNGTWTGSYDNGPTQVYNGTFDGRYEGSAPHWTGHHGRSGYQTHRSYGYGYGYGPSETIVTIHSAPITTTTTHVTEEVIYAAAPRKRYVAKRKTWKPRRKVHCVCR